jgi:hypothetical protein
MGPLQERQRRGNGMKNRYRVELIVVERDDCEPFTDETDVALFISHQVMAGAFIKASSVIATKLEETAE